MIKFKFVIDACCAMFSYYKYPSYKKLPSSREKNSGLVYFIVVSQ